MKWAAGGRDAETAPSPCGRWSSILNVGIRGPGIAWYGFWIARPGWGSSARSSWAGGGATATPAEAGTAAASARAAARSATAPRTRYIAIVHNDSRRRPRSASTPSASSAAAAGTGGASPTSVARRAAPDITAGIDRGGLRRDRPPAERGGPPRIDFAAKMARSRARAVLSGSGAGQSPALHHHRPPALGSAPPAQPALGGRALRRPAGAGRHLHRRAGAPGGSTRCSTAYPPRTAPAGSRGSAATQRRTGDQVLIERRLVRSSRQSRHDSGGFATSRHNQFDVGLSAGLDGGSKPTSGM